DGSGNPMVIWGRMSDESVFFSRWTGTSFSTPVKLNPTGFTVATASWMGPDIASKGDTVYVVVKQTPENLSSSNIYIIRSFDAGITFSAPIRVDAIADSISRFPTVSIDEAGNPIVAFMKFDSKFMNSRWAVAKSSDYGSTFSKDVKVSGWSGMDAEICDCCPGAVVSSGDVTAMLYRDNLKNIRDIWTGISTNNNTTYTKGFRADNTNWNINSCPASGPDGTIIGDSLYTVFLSGGSGDFRTYLSRSSISNGKASTVSPLTGSITGLSQQNYPRIANSGNAMAIVWKQIVNGRTQIPILFTNDIAKGFSTTIENVDLNDNTNVDVAMTSDKVFVVWEDDNAGTITYRTGTYTPSTTSVKDEIVQGDFSIYPNPASDFIEIEPDKYPGLITIYNQTGANVLEAESQERIDIRCLPSGVYFLKIGNKLSRFAKL
ncbi:MAG: T9SS type A sorting domain-containing protein, partial [Ignavibacteriae bacterium]|nr:T9SS type A sorting domain-containing protein [Ignavibacteriota bacterium]